jgi:hypothetical protein
VSGHSWVRDQTAGFANLDLEGSADTHTHLMLDQPPLTIGLQTAAEPIMLWPGGPALSYQPVIKDLALLAVSREFPDERYLAGILRLRIAPLSAGADRIAVHLLVDGVVDKIQVLLCQLDIGFNPGSQKLRLSWQPSDEGGEDGDHSER